MTRLRHARQRDRRWIEFSVGLRKQVYRDCAEIEGEGGGNEVRGREKGRDGFDFSPGRSAVVTKGLRITIVREEEEDPAWLMQNS